MHHLNLRLSNEDNKALPIIYSLSFIILSAFLGQSLSFCFSKYSEWVPFFFVGISAPLSILSFILLNKRNINHIIYTYLTVVMGISAALIIMYADYKSSEAMGINIKHGTFANISLILGLVLFLTYKVITYSHKLDLIQAITFLIITMSSWCSLFQLTNWGTIKAGFETEPFLTNVAFLCCIIFSFFFVLNILPKAKNRVALSHKNLYYGLIVTITIIIFTIFSFRHDTLFIGGSVYHWKYFVGPIQTLRNGGWLLWDTPSQYGFLNILAASLIPTKSSWDALYIFQALLLLLTAGLMLRILDLNIRNLPNYCIGIIIIISSLYFADPDLIGPYLYPSSSVLRFFWCYVFLNLLFTYWKKESFTLINFLGIGTLLWVPSALWSSESAIYTTVIFYSALVTAIIQNYAIKGVISRIKVFSYLATPILSLIFSMLLISCYYRININHLPDWKQFSFYGLAYASGFGSLPLDVYGSVWLLIMLFASIVSLVITLIITNRQSRSIVALVGTAACLWAISSYFIGRAAPQNITAILPIIVSITGFTLVITRSMKPCITTLLFKGISITIFTIALATTLANISFVDKFMAFSSFTPRISNKIPAPNHGLQLLIQKHKINIETPVAYLSYNGEMGKVKTDHGDVVNELSWLPSPMQLLNEPTTAKQRNKIIKRFANKFIDGGFLIHAKGEYEQQFQDWIKTLNVTYNAKHRFENDDWEVICFTPKASQQ